MIFCLSQRLLMIPLLTAESYIREQLGGTLALSSPNAPPRNLPKIQDAATLEFIRELTESVRTIHFYILNNNNLRVETLNLSNLPTSAAGLSSGDVWNDSGTLKIV